MFTKIEVIESVITRIYNNLEFLSPASPKLKTASQFKNRTSNSYSVVVLRVNYHNMET